MTEFLIIGFKVVGEDNIAALLEDETSDFEETDDEIESLPDRDYDKEQEDQREFATEEENESEIQDKTDLRLRFETS